jgi:crotonobetainyl-CoA:carnitine CoA-transferase CaiB-like acyl-CoA transferase
VSFRPLDGIRVVDVTTSFAGPYCTEILGALGADVVKIERPDTGDEARTWGPPFFDGTSTMFLSTNANKRSAAVELRRGREIVLRLAARADVFVQSLRPGLAEERGLGADDVRARNPRLVYCSINAFGRTGPLAAASGYDPLAQAAAGIISVTGEPDRPGVRVGVSIVDQSTGLWAALAILAALRQGEGASLDVSLYETAVSLMAYHLTGYHATGAVPGRHGTAFPSIAPYEVFRASDAELMIAVGNDRTFAAFAAALGRPELAGDVRFATNGDRVANRAELRALIAERIAEESREVWLRRLAEAAVPAAPVQDVGEVARHPQTEALGLMQPLGGLPVAGLPLSVDGDRVQHAAPAPALGLHTADVLREAGYADAEIDELRRSGVIA